MNDRGARFYSAIAVLIGACLIARPAEGFSGDWPRFRGVDGAGISEARGLPVDFGPKTNLIWRTMVPAGCSSPIVAGDRVWLAGCEENHRMVWCLDLISGRRLWERNIEATASEHKSTPNDAASSTPVTDGVNVYALFSGFGLISYGANGEERWRIPLGPFTQPHGMASSPILAGDQVIVLADQIQDSYIAAFATASGKLRWRTARPSFVGGYSTPLLWRDQVVVAGPVELAGYSQADGTRLWSSPKMGVMPIGSPARAGDRIFVNNGAVPPFEALTKMLKADHKVEGKILPDEFPDPSFKEAVLAIDRAYGNGDGALDKAEWDGALKLMETLNTLVAVQLTGPRPRELWRNTKLLADVASPLIYQNVLYLLKDGGLLTGLDPDSGEVLWRERVAEGGSRYFASPVAADGKIFLVGEDGEVSVVKAGRAYARLGLNDLGENCYATPAIGGKFLLIRTLGTLWAFGTP